MKNCKQCKQKFGVTDQDRDYYRKFGPEFKGNKYAIAEPDLCRHCRYQQRLLFRNERNLYYRKCDVTGESIVSIFSPDKSYPTVYSQDYWWSDKWDAKEYGRDYDFSKPFFEQWGDLFKEVPQNALNNSNSENSEFTNQADHNKNCYLIVASNSNEDCLHGMWMQHCKDSVDCLYLNKSELCYELMNGESCYHCTFSQDLENCTDCHFCVNCIGCIDCIGCVNLRNKKYHIFNKQYSSEEYHHKLKEFGLNSYSGISSLKKQINEFKKKFPQKYYHGSKTENFSGDYLYQIKNSKDSFNCRYCEDIKYCQDAWKARNCYDLTETLENDFCYGLEGSAYNNNVVFCMKIKETNNAYYSSHCFYSNFLFGCVGLRNSQYCILNKQYKRDEYENLVSKIIEHMIEVGEWGQYFPSKFGQFGYNETVAQEYFLLTKEEILEKGWKWSEYEKPLPDSNKVIPAEQLPETVDQVSDEILESAITCKKNGKLFTIQKAELDFYRNMDLPIPHLHPDVRHAKRMKLRNPRKLYGQICDNEGCNTEFETTYPQNSHDKVFCESCYFKEVY